MLFEKCLDVIRALSEAINIVKMGKHDPFRAHKTFYNWEEVTSRTEKVYDAVLKSRQMDLMERIQRCVVAIIRLSVFIVIMAF
jgi:phosphatidylinositol N-acetylglucosaminyltransferase subunit A